MVEFNDDSDDAPVFSSATLDALKEFYADRDARERQFADLKARTDDKDTENSALTMDAFQENWNESQFWYSQETATVLANQLLSNSTSETTIAVVSAPSVFVQLKNVLAASSKPESQMPKIYLLEFDDRFDVFPEFVFYDFHSPLKLPPHLRGAVDHIICDPPFLSEDCQTKAALTVRWLSKSWGTGASPQHSGEDESTSSTSKLIVCTGERMENLVNKLYRPQGLRTTNFEPVHAKGLSNEFYCYANFTCDDWGWKE